MKRSEGSAGNSHFNSDADIQNLGYSKVPDKKKALSCSNVVYLHFERRRKRLEERIQRQQQREPCLLSDPSRLYLYLCPKPTNSLAISQIRRASSFKSEIGTNSDTLSYHKLLRVLQPVLASRSHNTVY